jgi:hypothetical protein
MPSLKVFLLIFAMYMSINGGDAHRKVCSNVCPKLDLTLEETIYEGIAKIFGKGLPTDGICLEGSKNIYNGTYFGYPGESACVCFVTNVKSNFQGSCKPGETQCPAYVPGNAGDTLPTFFKYLTSEFPDKFNVADGCCPTGSAKWIQPGSSFGSASDVCGCLFPGMDFLPFKPK